MLHATKTILRSDGVTGLYRGLIPGIMQVTPLTGINFMFYNWLGSTTVEVMKLQSKRFDHTFICKQHFAYLYFQQYSSSYGISKWRNGRLFVQTHGLSDGFG